MSRFTHFLRIGAVVVILGQPLWNGVPAVFSAEPSSEAVKAVAGDVLPSPDVADLAGARSFEEAMSELAGLSGSEPVNEFRQAFQERVGSERRDSIDLTTTMAMKELVPLYQDRWRLMKSMMVAPRHRFLLDVFELNCLLTGDFGNDAVAAVLDRWQGDARGLLAVGCAEMALLVTSTRKAPEVLLLELKSAMDSSSRPELRSRASEILRLLTEPPPKPRKKLR